MQYLKLNSIKWTFESGKNCIQYSKLFWKGWKYFLQLPGYKFYSFYNCHRILQNVSYLSIWPQRNIVSKQKYNTKEKHKNMP